ncbi:radical SAM/SPASM domain-containing protein [Desulfosarcina ovata]|uniref:Radical SAM/SPASM domain-containing protein n=1 Tax=Desulfosarcina ovata subsp. ovata TaxID=2752305 RepID=A0A5K8AC29_9BACT|nr:SPASM domain-containing protein [Desulfosarcina ovata]BBO90066.1 radical SAM/SPASM domain-containing protein [Desulfosarcina ovata subsp. ovata]
MPTHKISCHILDGSFTYRGVEYATLHHTLTKADCILPRSAWKRVADNDPDLKQTVLWPTLKAQGFLVPAGTDEFQLFLEWRNDHARNYGEVKSRVLYTRVCDNDCAYCSLMPHLRRGFHMSAETARLMDRFHAAFIEEKRPLAARDAFLGGEPFLNYAVMRDSARRRLACCQAQGIPYRFSVTTNGKHLNVARIDALLACGLETLHVSLAGPAEVHDRLRPSLGGGPNYHKVLGNLAAISGRVPVIIEYQYDAAAEDYRRIGEMIADFGKRDIEIAGIEVTPILPRRQDNRFTAGFGDLTILHWINAVIEDAGFPADRSAPLFACIADQKAYHVYDVDGSIIPCPSLQLGERAYGHVTTGIDYVAETQLLERRFPEECRTCALLPTCMGGCRLRADMENGDFNGVICNRDHLETELKRYMRQKAKDELERRDACGELFAIG